MIVFESSEMAESSNTSDECRLYLVLPRWLWLWWWWWYEEEEGAERGVESAAAGDAHCEPTSPPPLGGPGGAPEGVAAYDLFLGVITDCCCCCCCCGNGGGGPTPGVPTTLAEEGEGACVGTPAEPGVRATKEEKSDWAWPLLCAPPPPPPASPLPRLRDMCSERDCGIRDPFARPAAAVGPIDDGVCARDARRLPDTGVVVDGCAVPGE